MANPITGLESLLNRREIQIIRVGVLVLKRPVCPQLRLKGANTGALALLLLA